MNTPVSGIPRALLRVEGLAILVSGVVAYHQLGTSWSFFAAAFLAPDIALVAYLAGPRIGALAYNTVHTYVAPASLAALAYLDVVPNAWPVCLIWLAHIGLDRSLGLGLKFATAFGDTHLGHVGRLSQTT